MTTLKQRFQVLKQAMPEIKPAALARATGKSAASVSDWFSGKTHSLQADSAAKVALVYGCNALWLSTGEGEAWPTSSQAAGNVAGGSAPTSPPTSPIAQLLADIASLPKNKRDVVGIHIKHVIEGGEAEVADALEAIELELQKHLGNRSGAWDTPRQLMRR